MIVSDQLEVGAFFGAFLQRAPISGGLIQKKAPKWH